MLLKIERKISQDGYFINSVFSIFALIVFKFFAAILLKEIKFFLASRKLLTNFNNYCS